MKHPSLAPFTLGVGIGSTLLAALMLIVSGVRLDERGEAPYGPELIALWGSLAGGMVMALVDGSSMARRLSRAR